MLLTGNHLTVQDVNRIAFEGEQVELDDEAIARLGATCDRVQQWGAQRQPIYGVTTGFGELVNRIIPPDRKTQLQCNLLLSHAAGAGEYFRDSAVRAMIVARMNCLIKGYSGVSREAVTLMAQFLNRHVHPIVPEQGSLGASGDLAPLSHLALPLIGEGEVRYEGRVRPSKDVLGELGLQPLRLGFKEALSLINGTSAMTGVACVAIREIWQIVRVALLASADYIQCLEASTRAYDERGHALKNHPGQIEIAATLRVLLEDSAMTHDHRELMLAISSQAKANVSETDIFIQNAYSLRCIPQILGPVLDTLRFVTTIVTNELNSCNDNPLFFSTPDDTFHGGNFHGQYVAMACDFLNIALTEVGVLAERQLNRLLDPHLNGHLPPFLAMGDAGLFCGFEGAQYLATSIASENLDLAAPSSVKSIPSNGSNQDVVSMGLIAGRKTLRLTENVRTMLAVLVAACQQAHYSFELKRFSNPVRSLHHLLSDVALPYADNLPISTLILAVKDRLNSPDARMFFESAAPMSGPHFEPAVRNAAFETVN